MSLRTETDVSQATVKLAFFLHAVASGSFFTRVPDLQEGLGLDAATLGLALIGQPVGAIGMFLVSSAIIERAGTRHVLLWGLPLLAVSLLLMALAPSAAILFVTIAAYSAIFAVTNVALNVEADRIEHATGERLMNTCHGMWSIGQLVVFALGAVARGFDISPVIQFAVIVPLMLAATLATILPMRPAPLRAHAATETRRRIALPSAATLRLLGFMLGGGLVEAAARQWSVIYSRDSFAAPDWADSLTLPVFVAFIALGRFFGDGWTHRFGPARLARVLVSIAAAGTLIVVVAPSLPVALAGFALMGFGICTTFPASTSAAAQLGDRPSSENVAALTLSVQTVLLGAPPLMGFLADAFGIRATFGMILPMLILAIFLAGGLEPRRTAPRS